LLGVIDNGEGIEKEALYQDYLRGFIELIKIGLGKKVVQV
jgi:hypothetical protein